MGDVTSEAAAIGETVAKQQISPTWLGATFSALRYPAYRPLWLNCVFMMTAVHLAFTAQNILAYDITGNNRAVGFVAFAQGTALLVTTPFAGVIADRLSRRLLFGSELLLCSMAVALSVLIYAGAITIVLVAIGGFLFGSSLSLFWPAITASMAEAVEPEERANGAALFQVALQLTRATAPFLASGLIAWDAVGVGGTYLIVSVIFVPVLLTAAYVPGGSARPHETPNMWREIGLGIGYVIANRALLQAMVSFIVIMLLGFSILVVLPAFTKDVLGAGNSGFGIMFGLNAVGAFVASLFAASLGTSKVLPALLLGSSLAFGLCIALTGVMPSFALALLTMLLAGATGGGFQTLITAAMLRKAEPAYFGRVMSLTTIAWSLTNLAGLVAGVLADIAGERAVLIGVGLTLSLAAALLALWSRTGEGPLRSEHG